MFWKLTLAPKNLKLGWWKNLREILLEKEIYIVAE